MNNHPVHRLYVRWARAAHTTGITRS